MATKLPWRLQLKPNALDLMADAMGRPEHLLGKDGKPKQEILLGAENNAATASNILGERVQASASAVATIITRYAAATGISNGQALDALFDVVPSVRTVCEAAA